MKSFCFKTNNIRILEYILKRIDEIDFENLIYSKNKFSIYENVIIHYFGNDNEAYYEFLSKLLEEIVIEFFEEKILKQLINYNYFYFDEYEKIKILENSIQIIEPEECIKYISENKDVKEYLKQNKSMILEGFIYFRLKNYISYLDNIIDYAVNQFIIEKNIRNL